MDKVLQDLLRKQQAQQMVAERQAKQQQQTALENLMRGQSPDVQARLQAFPGSAEGVLFPTADRRVISPGDVLLEGNVPVYEAPRTEETSQTYRDYLQAQAQGYPGSFLDYQTALKQAGRTQVTATATAGGGIELTPGQRKLDEAAAADFFQWQSGGGQDMAAQIAQLKPVIADLEAGKPITGISVAVQPDLLLAMTNPKALQNREAVEEVVQRNLRVILGAQFTEKEGERLISRAFNPRLPPAENAKRVRRLFLQMETAAQQKQAMVDYFNENGTLKGYKGKMPTVGDFERAMEGNVSQPSAAGVRRFNPATGRVE
jgi:hypothetical protein